MKRIAFLLLAAIMASHSMSAPARGGWKNIVLDDGSIVKVKLVGDEFCHYYITEDGRAIGDIPQRISKNRSDIMKANTRSTSSDPIATPGKKKQLVLLMEFADKTFMGDDAYNHWNAALNTGKLIQTKEHGSLHQYFIDQSHGIFDVDFDIYGPFTAEYGYEHYGKNGNNGFDKIPGDLVVEGLKAIEGKVNLSDYDWDGDGNVEQVVVIYASAGENDSSVQNYGYDNPANLIWPHQYYLEYATTDKKNYTYEGISVSSYCILNHEFRGEIDGFGTFAHEYSHCLGLPDFYQTDGSPHGKDNFGNYDSLAKGCFNGDSWCPANYTAFEKYSLGWYEPLTLTEPTTIDGLQPMSEGGEAYFINNDGNANEFYMLENRLKSGWDTYIPGEGLLVTHYDYDDMAWRENTINNIANHQRATIIPASNNTIASQFPYPYVAKNLDGTEEILNDCLTDDSKPAAMVFNKNVNGTNLMGKPLTNIRRDADGLISFDFMGGTSDIRGIMADSDPTDLEYFDLQGRKVSVPSRGIYIIRNKKTNKTYKSSF